MWLTSEFLNWERQVSSWDSTGADAKRAYILWAHAEHILAQYNDDLHLIDAITTIKRAMSHHLKLIKDTFKLDKLPLAMKPKGTIEQLAFLKIMRPTMLLQLIDIRNAVEHEDGIPPTHERCLELLDFVWYFLRSTDRLTTYQVNEIEFEMIPIEDSLWLTLETNPKNDWRINIHGWVDATMILESVQKDWFEVQINISETLTEILNRKQPKEQKEYLAERNIKEGDLFISGTIIGPERKLQEIISLYFGLAIS